MQTYTKKLNNKDLYFVAVKIFLEDKDSQLFIFKDRFGDWDLPGGRIRYDEFDKSLEKVIKRKIEEELGKNVKYELGQPVVFMRHEREEILLSNKKEKTRIFAIGYRAKYLGGDINLGKNHLYYKFVSIKRFNPGSYFKGGWLKGVREYRIMRNRRSGY